MSIPKSVSLEFVEGSSNKFYDVELKQKDTGWIVTFQYGRKGNSPTVGTKTEGPVSYELATKVFEKLIKEKIGKGYKEINSTKSSIPDAIVKIDTGIRCQLLNEIPEEDIQKYIDDPNWCAQEKFDGERRLANKKDGGINRKGQAVILDDQIRDEIILNEGSVTVDGELIGTKIYAFDYLMEKLPYRERLKLLEANYGHYNTKSIIVIYTAYTKEEKQKLFDELKARNAEGIVFKDLRALYTPGRPASGGTQLKFKFCETVTCIVCGRSSTKRSIALALLDEKGGEITVGNATIYPNFAIPNINDLVEIKYLYAYPGGSLYQPVYKGVRTDIEMKECLLTQLKYKAGTV